MKKGNCKYCRHWGDTDEQIYDAQGELVRFRRCMHQAVGGLRQNTDYRNVRVIVTPDTIYPHHAKNIWKMLTHPKYRCCLFESK